MEVNDPNKSNALCASYEHVLADEKKNLDSKKMAREEKRREEEGNSVGLNQHGMNQKTVHLSV